MPHINDTLLLIAGISLVVLLGFNPLHQPWLLIKIVALLLYILLGTIALKTHGIKSTVAYVLATLTVLFMVFTALNKAPFVFGT